MLAIAEFPGLLAQDPLPEPFGLLENGFIYLATLDLLARVENAPLLALRALEGELAVRYPKKEVPDHARHVFGNDLKRYRSFVATCLIFVCSGGVAPSTTTPGRPLSGSDDS